MRKKNGAGAELAEWMRTKGMTQEQLAAYMGVTRQAVSKWLNGHSPSPGLAIKLYDRTGIPALKWWS